MQTATSQTNKIDSGFDAIKARQQATWGSGDYGKVGVTLQITGEQLCEALDVRAGDRVLDVAAGNGNASLAAARRFCKVMSTDYVQALLDLSRIRANAEGLPIEYQLADAENLPFADGQFDHVISTFGVMFAPDQSRCASELLRVCRKGGKIGLANWTPDGFIGRLFKIIGSYIAPPPGLNSPLAWGTEEFLTRTFSRHVGKINVEHKQFALRYESAEHFLDIFRNYYGPTLKAFQALDEEKARAMAADIIRLLESFNRADDERLVVDSDYLEVVLTR